MKTRQTIKVPLIGLFVAALAVLLGCQSQPRVVSADAEAPTTPRRLVLIVFDQLPTSAFTQKELPNLKAMTSLSLHYPHALVGHLSSQSIVSLPVIQFGARPNELVWTDTIWQDAKGLLGKRKAFYEIEKLSPNTLTQLLRSVKRHRPLVDRLRAVIAGNSYTISPSPVRASVLAAGSQSAEIALSEKEPSGQWMGYRRLTGRSLPDFLQNDSAFFLRPNAQEKLARVPKDSRALASEADTRVKANQWVTQIALEIMEKDPTWNILQLNYAAIDQSFHDFGSAKASQWAKELGYSYEQLLSQADQQIGRLLAALTDNRWLNETVVVVSATHGGQDNQSVYAKRSPSSTEPTHIFGKGENFESSVLPKPLSQHIQSKDIEVSVHDTMIRFWLKNPTFTSTALFARKLRNLPGVREVYTSGEELLPYIRVYRAKDIDERTTQWISQHHARLLESFSGPGAPNVVALLKDGHGYGSQGGFGGAQEQVQRIALLILSPMAAPETRVRPIRLSELATVIEEQFDPRKASP